MQTNDTYCHHGMVNQAIHMFNGNTYVNLCCESSYPDKAVLIQNVSDINIIRNDLANGIRHHHCTSCWNKEANGILSLRQLQNKLQIPNYRSFQIFFDNTCDLACIYCNSSFSSKWEQEYNSAEPNDKLLLHSVSRTNDHVSDKRNAEANFGAVLSHIAKTGADPEVNSCTIQLLGGETLLSSYFKKNLISDIVDAFYSLTSPLKGLSLVVVTNGNTPDSIMARALDTITELKKKYKNFSIQISLSMESTGEVAEYIRYGLNWEQFDKNVKKWLNIDVQVHFNLSINIISLADTPNFVAYLINLNQTFGKKVKVRFSYVDYPKSLSIRMLPSELGYILDQVRDLELSAPDVIISDPMSSIEAGKSRLGSITNEAELRSLKKEALKYFDYIKRVRGKDIVDINPSLVTYLNT